MRFWGTRIVVTLDLISKVLYVPKVAHLDYLGCDRLQTMSRDELLSHFCETPSIWGGKQNTLCSGFAKGLRFLNMVMTFVLTPLSHYNSIIEPSARFLLSLLKVLNIDFPTHFITSVLDVYQDTATRDKLIFLSAILRIFFHFSIPIPSSPYFTTMGAIDAGSARWSEARLQLKRPWMETMDPSASAIPSTSAPSSSSGGVSLETIMVQL